MTRPLINIVIPVHNEEHVLAASVGKIISFLAEHNQYEYEIVIANNASTDRTLEVALRLQGLHREVKVLHLEEKGRGRAVRQAWAQSKAAVLSYMDVDLSSHLPAFLDLIDPLVGRRYDLAAGSRLLRPELTNRSLKRQIISRSYNLLVRGIFHTRFSDAQCGFKAITSAAAAELLPLVKDNSWFMDTELLLVAEKLGFGIFDLPVRWIEDPDSSVKIWRTAVEDIRGLMRVYRKFARGEYRRSTAIPVRKLYLLQAGIGNKNINLEPGSWIPEGKE